MPICEIEHAINVAYLELLPPAFDEDSCDERRCFWRVLLIRIDSSQLGYPGQRICVCLERFFEASRQDLCADPTHFRRRRCTPQHLCRVKRLVSSQKNLAKPHGCRPSCAVES